MCETETKGAYKDGIAVGMARKYSNLRDAGLLKKESAPSASTNTQSKQALREIAASINAEAGFSKNENYRVPASVLERWAQQLLAL
jgi:hypothetical protein